MIGIGVDERECRNWKQGLGELRPHLLFRCQATEVTPDAYMVTLNSTEHGAIQFAKPGWKSAGVRPISVSLRGQRYEASDTFHLGLEPNTSTFSASLTLRNAELII